MTLSPFSSLPVFHAPIRFGLDNSDSSKVKQEFALQAVSLSGGYESLPEAPLTLLTRQDEFLSGNNKEKRHIPMPVLNSVLARVAKDHPDAEMTVTYQAPSTTVTMKGGEFEKAAKYPVHISVNNSDAAAELGERFEKLNVTC